jgi:Fe(3+) dicitrate transport protein
MSNTLQLSHTSDSFSDAHNNVRPTEDATGGLIPAYTVVDWSFAVQLTNQQALSLGINNLAGARYPTKRTAEYPGPGILPGSGRSMYLGVRVAF